MSEKTKRRQLSFKEKYELIKEVKAGAPKEFLFNKYCITDRMYNCAIDNEPEVKVKVKSYEFEKKSSKTSANIIFLYFCSSVFFLVCFPQRQESYDVTDIVSHIVAVFLANIEQL